MEEIDHEKLKEQLIEILNSYLKDSNDKKMKQKAINLHSKFFTASPVLNKNINHAIALLIDIGHDLPNPPKPSKEITKDLIKKIEV